MGQLFPGIRELASVREPGRGFRGAPGTVAGIVKIRTRMLWAVLALSVMATDPAWSAAAGGGVHLSDAQQKSLDDTSAPLAAGQHKAQVDAFAKVLDPGPLAQLNSDLLTAVAAAEASRAEA